jgi:hypothetical protein
VLVRRFLEHLSTTAPGDATVLVHQADGRELPVETARVETRPGHYGPVVIVYLKP